MRLLVFGGRAFGEVPDSRAERSWLPPEVVRMREWQRGMIFHKLDLIHAKYGIDVIIQGRAPGADSCGGQWAFRNGIPQLGFSAEWNTYQKAAGPRRNQQMIDEGKPTRGLGFPGDVGTRDMLKRLLKHIPGRVNCVNAVGDWLTEAEMLALTKPRRYATGYS